MTIISPDVITTLHSIRDYIRWAASRFAEHNVFLGHGTVTPLDEAAAIVLHTLHQPYDLADGYLNSVLTQAERQAVLAVIERRITWAAVVEASLRCWFYGRLTGITWVSDYRRC